MTSEYKNDCDFKWYAVQVATGYEKKTVQELKAKMDADGLSDMFGEILVPTEEVIELRNGKKRKTDRKLIPGYVFIQMEMENDSAWYLVRNASKVLGFIGVKKGSKPAPLPTTEVETLLSRVYNIDNAPKPKVLYESGEMIRVSSGPFEDFQGVVEEVNYEKSRMVVSVLIFGRSTPVELEFGQVEKIT